MSSQRSRSCRGWLNIFCRCAPRGKRLADRSDMASGLHAELTAQSGGVEESIRHLTHADLEAYLEARLSPARLQHCGTHLDSCEACRAELEDLRTFKSDLAGFRRPEPDRCEPVRRKHRRGLKLPQPAAVASIVVAAIAAVLWWGWERARTNKTSVAVAVPLSLAPAPAPVPVAAPVPTAGIQTRDTRLADEIAALPADVRSAVSEAIQ